MEIKISEDAFKWFQEEMEVAEGEAVRFYVRYGGSGLQPGFSLGVTKDQPDETAAEVEKDQVVYFVEQKDLWYFDSHNLTVTVNDELDELDYSYE
ncbi:HesB/YadR/YfhF family protein [Metaplanococcus flavidus]|uniref:HesB/YadR/YfhF family protein n=1 Tax=Metaplanococcus flavidus TaxID=569883 RepID=A0ABW3LA70_9BACL